MWPGCDGPSSAAAWRDMNNQLASFVRGLDLNKFTHSAHDVIGYPLFC